MVPALERLENRQNETECEASAAKERIEGLRRELLEIKERIQERFKDLYGKYNDLMDACRKTENEVINIKKDVTDLKDNEKGLGQKAWDLFKIIFTTGITAFVTWWLTKPKG